jgi:hypothetical protein
VRGTYRSFAEEEEGGIMLVHAVLLLLLSVLPLPFPVLSYKGSLVRGADAFSSLGDSGASGTSGTSGTSVDNRVSGTAGVSTGL